MAFSSRIEQACVFRAREVLRYYLPSASPPVDPALIASKLGFQVMMVRSAGDEFSGLVSPNHKLIGVNASHHPHRRRFTIAHELAHIVLNHPPERRCTAVEIRQYNREADLFASEILIPAQLLAPLLRRSFSLRALAKLFDVSEEAMRLKVAQIEKPGP